MIRVSFPTHRTNHIVTLRTSVLVQEPNDKSGAVVLKETTKIFADAFMILEANKSYRFKVGDEQMDIPLNNVLSIAPFAHS